MHFKNARNASVYAVFRAFFTKSLAKLRSHHTIKTYNKYIIAYVYTAFNLCALPSALTSKLFYSYLSQNFYSFFSRPSLSF